MSQSTTLMTALTASQLAAMNGEQIVKMGRELVAQLGSDPDGFHGNIWPGNIHLDEDGKAVLGEGSEAPVSARTPEQIEYMAPEAFWENDFSRSADLYSIALLMFTAYNGGCLPFTSSQQPEDTERAQALRTRMKGGEIVLPESVSEAVGAILKRELSYSAADRYLTAQTMLHDLGDTDEALPSEAPDGEQAVDPQAAAAAAATGMTGVSVVAEIAAIPKEVMRPVEAAAGVSASSILMEKELHDLEPVAVGAKRAEPLKEIFAEPDKPKTAAPKKTEARAETMPKTASASGGKKKGKSAPKPTAAKPGDAKATEKKPDTKPAEVKTAEKKPDGKPAEAKATENKPAEKPAETKTTQSKTASAPKAPAKAESKTETKAAPKTAGKAAAKAAPKGTGQTADKPAPKKQSAAAKGGDRHARDAKRKKLGGTAVVIGVGVLVVAGLIGVAAYSLGAFEKAEPMAIVTAEPVVETTAEPTVAPTATPEPVVPSYHFTATALDFDWDSLENVGLAVLDGEDALDAVVAAAENAGLENVWLGARYLEADDAPNGEAGWYWLDDTRLPENSAFWAAGEPAANEGGRLMLCRAADGSWRFHAVTREMFDEGEYKRLGCVTDGSGMAALPTPTPTPTPEPTAVPQEQEASRSYTYYAPSATVTETATVVPTAEPTAAPSVTAEPTTAPVVTAAPTAAPTATPTTAPTATPAPEAKSFRAERGAKTWTQLNEAETKFVTIQSAEDFAAVVEFLDAYNETNTDKLHNVWLGAEYKAADTETGREAGWYWLDGTALEAADENWAAEQTGEVGCKLMLRYVDGQWKYYSVTDGVFTAELETTYVNSGVIESDD